MSLLRLWRSAFTTEPEPVPEQRFEEVAEPEEDEEDEVTEALSIDASEENVVLHGWRQYRVDFATAMLYSAVLDHQWSDLTLRARCATGGGDDSERIERAREHIRQNTCECGIWGAVALPANPRIADARAQMVAWGFVVTDEAGNWRAEHAAIAHLEITRPVTQRVADGLKARYAVPIEFRSIVTPLWFIIRALRQLWDSRVMGGYPNLVRLPDLSRDVSQKVSNLITNPDSTVWYRDRDEGLQSLSRLAIPVAMEEDRIDITGGLTEYLTTGRESALLRVLEDCEEGKEPWDN